MVQGGPRVLYLPRHGHLAELALAVPRASEVEAEHGEAVPREITCRLDEEPVGLRFVSGEPVAHDEARGRARPRKVEDPEDLLAI